jgi:hypothetical protein
MNISPETIKNMKKLFQNIEKLILGYNAKNCISHENIEYREGCHKETVHLFADLYRDIQNRVWISVLIIQTEKCYTSV